MPTHQNNRTYHILTVDDKPANLFAMEKLLRTQPGVAVHMANSGDEALSLLLDYDYCLAIVDVQMPTMDGYELVSLLRGHTATARLPVIFVSAIFSDEYHHRKGYEIGAVDFISKPFNPDILMSKVRVFMQLYDQRMQLQDWNQSLERQVAQRTAQLAQAYDSTLEGWARALELREKETAGHSRRVVDLTMAMVKQVAISQEKHIHIYRGALLHDIGKMGIPDSILLKPGKLTEEEWSVMRLHPVYAYKLLSEIEYLQPALEIPYSHHEHWDGTGYPQRLKGDAIPFPARIFALVDVWDALCSDRPYRQAWERGKISDYIRQLKGAQFDPQLVEPFLALAQARL